MPYCWNTDSSTKNTGESINSPLSRHHTAAQRPSVCMSLPPSYQDGHDMPCCPRMLVIRRPRNCMAAQNISCSAFSTSLNLQRHPRARVSASSVIDIVAPRGNASHVISDHPSSPLTIRKSKTNKERKKERKKERNNQALILNPARDGAVGASSISSCCCSNAGGALGDVPHVSRIGRFLGCIGANS
jgi:uncharacterized protein (DUF2249 family)